MSLKIAPLRDEHLEDAAALVTVRYRALRGRAPSLPSRYEGVSSILPPLRDLAGQAPGVVAMRDGRLVGFLLGTCLRCSKGNVASTVRSGRTLQMRRTVEKPIGKCMRVSRPVGLPMGVSPM